MLAESEALSIELGAQVTCATSYVVFFSITQPFSAIVEEVFAGRRCPAADRKGVGVRSLAAEHSKGNFKRTTWLPL